MRDWTSVSTHGRYVVRSRTAPKKGFPIATRHPIVEWLSDGSLGAVLKSLGEVKNAVHINVACRRIVDRTSASGWTLVAPCNPPTSDKQASPGWSTHERITKPKGTGCSMWLLYGSSAWCCERGGPFLRRGLSCSVPETLPRRPLDNISETHLVFIVRPRLPNPR
ncbi:hypothetical protein LZ30DRAFT_333914 [Colletotrichum cereale]|nr:hypothetical protein LZ30DRAFT_333914 [Colletotrichum cereale]